MHPDEIEELMYQANGDADYLREAFGDSADCGDDYDPDYTVGGVMAWPGVEAFCRSLYRLARECAAFEYSATGKVVADPDYIPF